VVDRQALMVGTYSDLTIADADYAALRRLYDSLGAPHDFDAVTIARKTSGEVRFHLGLEDGRGSGGTDDTTWSVAAGLAAALFPSVGADSPSSRSLQLEVLAAVAGTIAQSTGRAGLMSLGSHLDESPAALLAAASPEHESCVREALSQPRNLMAKWATVDLAFIEDTARAAQRRVRH